MDIGGRHWAIAVAAAAAIHVGGTLAVLWQPPESGAKAAGLGGVEISLGPAGGAPGDVAAPESRVEKADPVNPAEVAEARPMEVEPVRQPDVAQPLPEPLETVAVEPRPVVEEVKPVDTRPVEIAETVPVRTPPPVPKRKPRRVTEEVKPVKPPEPKSIPIPETAIASPPPVEQVAASTPSVAGAGGRAGTQASTEAGASSSQASGGGLPGQGADYMSLLQAWLEKHKKYPSGARARRQEGTALLYFVMDRDGRIGEYRIERSSGYPVLDKEVLALLERAKPLPAPPPEVPGGEIKLIVPVQFFLR